METPSIDESAVRVSTDAHIDPREAGRARRLIAGLARVAPRPVVSARVRLTRHGDPAVARPVVARAALDLSGRVVVAHAAGETVADAVDDLTAGLRHRFDHLDQEPAHTEPPWREPARVRAWTAIPDAEREVVVHTSWSAAPCTVDDAAAEMGLLGFDFHLFTELGTGQDAVLHRVDDGYRLELETPPGPHDLAPFRLPVTIASSPAPLLDTHEAIARMELLGAPFLFFVDGERGRGAVVHRRGDGHYGRIEPQF